MKFAAAAVLAALIATPVLAADLPVSSAPVVRIAVTGKTDAQVAAEIQTAAAAVCGAPAGSCVDAAVRYANSQYVQIKRGREHDATQARMSKIEVVRDDHATVRVKVAGRTTAQINSDIEYAAHAVCIAVGAGDMRGCVAAAARNARSQLGEVAQARPEQVASR